MRTQALRAALLAVAAGAGLVAAGVPPAAAAHAATATVAPGVRLSPDSGPPTSTVRVSGTGFGAHRAVDIYFDTTDKALASTNGNGAFSGIRVRVPASAVPGTHYITAVQRHSGRSAQARFLVNTNWSQFHYSAAHTGFNRYENVLSASNVAGLGLDWSFRAGCSDPAVANGVVFVVDCGSNNGTTNFYALNAGTGARLWRLHSTSAFVRPVVANGVVYVGTEALAGGHLYALNAATGARIWSLATGDFGPSTTTVANGVVYLGSFTGKVWALKASTGAKLWSRAIGTLVQGLAVANGVVYLGGDDGNLYALNAATGAKIWTFTTGNTLFKPTVANGVVYVGADNGNLYALNAATGASLWTFTTGAIVEASAAVANGVIYVGSGDGNLYALNAVSGAKVWSFTTGDRVFSSAAVANGVIYVGSGDGNVYALNAATGARLWTFTTGFSVFSSPAVANGVVDIGSEDGNVYAFHLPGGVTTVNRPHPGQLHPNYALRPQNGKRP
jgi:outer membrane protein assembly factor BamB